MTHTLPPLSTSRHCLMLIALLASSFAYAQSVHRVVGPDGRVTFSDRPASADSQPSTEIAIQLPASNTNTAQTQLPFALRQVIGLYPVTLYTTKDCLPCDEGRSYLQGRGIPFTERTIESSSDQAALKKLSGQDSLPFATIGSQYLKGFDSGNWGQYLTAAGYPAQSQLPKNYQAPAPKPLTVSAPAAAEKHLSTPSPATPSPAPAPTSITTNTPSAVTPDNPAGLRF